MMKYIYSVLALFGFLLLGTSCEEEYRDMVLFGGVEPIYQVGTCNNLLSSVTLYLDRPEGAVLGIDGGDGRYELTADGISVAVAEFSEDLNGYRRIRVLPKAEGCTNIGVADGSGHTLLLQVVVKECYKYHLFVEDVAYSCTQEIDETLWESIQVTLDEQMTAKRQACTYTLIPDREDDGGVLRVSSDPLVDGFVSGTYELIESPDKEWTLRFCYNDEVHDFCYSNPLLPPDTKNLAAGSLLMYEDVTSLIDSNILPEGCRVIRIEKWMYLPDTILTE